MVKYSNYGEEGSETDWTGASDRKLTNNCYLSESQLEVSVIICGSKHILVYEPLLWSLHLPLGFLVSASPRINSLVEYSL